MPKRQCLRLYISKTDHSSSSLINDANKENEKNQSITSSTPPSLPTNSSVSPSVS